MTYQILLLFAILSTSCTDSKNHTRASKYKEESAIAVKETKSKSNEKFIDGLYLNEWNHSGFLLIHSGKIHHFNRKEFTSAYKDEEYDYESITSEGFIHINRKYYLDRNKKIIPKETLLTDIEVVLTNEVVTALVRNGRTFTKIQDLYIFFSKFPEINISQYKEKCIKEHGTSGQIIDAALKSKKFYFQSGLPYRQLRDGQIEFYELLVNIVNSKK